MSVSRHISNEGVIQLVNACAFADEQGTPFTLFATIAWSKTRGWTEVTHSARQTEFFKKLATWMGRRGLPTAYLWTLEKSNRIGLHQNLAIHVPDRLFPRLVKALPKMIPGFIPDRHILEIISDPDGPPKYFFHVNQRRGTLRYFLKGMDHRATFNGPDGELRNWGDHVGVEHRGQQGTITGKRYGTSAALGTAARRKAAYEDRTSPDGVKALLAPIIASGSHQKAT